MARREVHVPLLVTPKYRRSPPLAPAINKKETRCMRGKPAPRVPEVAREAHLLNKALKTIIHARNELRNRGNEDKDQPDNGGQPRRLCGALPHRAAPTPSHALPLQESARPDALDLEIVWCELRQPIRLDADDSLHLVNPAPRSVRYGQMPAHATASLARHSQRAHPGSVCTAFVNTTHCGWHPCRTDPLPMRSTGIRAPSAA